MYTECRHILPSGRKCKSPALTGKTYCYFHDRLIFARDDGTRPNDEPLKLPPLEDARGLQLALTQVLSALGSGRINTKQASVYLYGLQLAMQLVKHVAIPRPIETVRNPDVDGAGVPIGPETKSCDPYIDCATCETKDTCLNADRLNMRSMHQILRAMHHGQSDWDKKLDQAENPTPPQLPAFALEELERQKKAEETGEFYDGPTAQELQEEVEWLLARDRKDDPLNFRDLIDPGNLYNFKRAQPNSRT